MMPMVLKAFLAKDSSCATATPDPNGNAAIKPARATKCRFAQRIIGHPMPWPSCSSLGGRPVERLVSEPFKSLILRRL
jgi:hypothetical protein